MRSLSLKSLIVLMPGSIVTSRFGIDDSGSLRVCFRFASDQTRPQFEDPTRPNYTTVEASNNAVLEIRYDPKGNVRPWDRTLYIKVVKGFLREGDTITIRFGVTEGGSPGMRLQTFCEDTFEFRVLVDPIATFNFQAMPVQPVIRIVPGKPEVKIMSRLMTNPIALKQIVRTLNENLERYEKAFGPIPVEPPPIPGAKGMIQ